MMYLLIRLTVSVDYSACDVRVHGCACGPDDYLNTVTGTNECVSPDMCSCYDFVQQKVYPAGEEVQENCRKWWAFEWMKSQPIFQFNKILRWG